MKHIAGLLGVSHSWVRTAEQLDYDLDEMESAAANKATEEDMLALGEDGIVSIDRPGQRALKAVVPPTRRAK